MINATNASEVFNSIAIDRVGCNRIPKP